MKLTELEEKINEAIESRIKPDMFDVEGEWLNQYQDRDLIEKDLGCSIKDMDDLMTFRNNIQNLSNSGVLYFGNFSLHETYLIRLAGKLLCQNQ